MIVSKQTDVRVVAESSDITVVQKPLGASDHPLTFGVGYAVASSAIRRYRHSTAIAAGTEVAEAGPVNEPDYWTPERIAQHAPKSTRIKRDRDDD